MNSSQLKFFSVIGDPFRCSKCGDVFGIFTTHKLEFNALLIASDNSLDFNTHICTCFEGLELDFYTKILSAYKSFVVIFVYETSNN